jgi:hypothetical protein
MQQKLEHDTHHSCRGAALRCCQSCCHLAHPAAILDTISSISLAGGWISTLTKTAGMRDRDRAQGQYFAHQLLLHSRGPRLCVSESYSAALLHNHHTGRMQSRVQQRLRAEPPGSDAARTTHQLLRQSLLVALGLPLTVKQPPTQTHKQWGGEARCRVDTTAHWQRGQRWQWSMGVNQSQKPKMIEDIGNTQ